MYGIVFLPFSFTFLVFFLKLISFKRGGFRAAIYYGIAALMTAENCLMYSDGGFFLLGFSLRKRSGFFTYYYRVDSWSFVLPFVLDL